MSYFRSLLDSLGSLFSADPDSSGHDAAPGSEAHTMDGVASGPSAVVGERIAQKLKGYFELAKEEIDKAVRAEEWGLVEDAVVHYTNANRILLEAKAARVPPAISSSEQDKVKSYHQKISKWHGQVSERLRVLSQRAGISPKKVDLPHPQTRILPSTASCSQKSQGTFTSARSSLATQNKKISPGSTKPNQETLNNYDAKLVEIINTSIIDRSPAVRWDDVAGLEKAKQSLLEMVILPTKRRDLFTGLRKPARGNGKTMLAKAVASESEATFFNVSASSLTSKWVGEAEKLVRTLFMVAISRQPSVIFMDEIDSIMSTRLASENDSSRRLKSEFLVQFDGVASNPNDLVIVIGASNKPQELDDAVLRRLVKRIYVPLPDEKVRMLLLKNQLKGRDFSLPDSDLERLVKETEGYSGSDLQALCEEAAMMPLRELGHQILTVKADQVRPLRYPDFQKAMSVIRPSYQKSKWEELEQWNKEFGSN
uniref:microtubule-severing ATPase n=1 Tax=Anthurium amnicola TaxID=1678845 RepID=A0A1D1Z4G9_9ARAE